MVEKMRESQENDAKMTKKAIESKKKDMLREYQVRIWTWRN